MGMMRCPRCVLQIHRGAGECPHCGFTLRDADARYGVSGVSMRVLADSAGMFRERDRLRIQTALDRFHRRFPQLFMAIYTGSGGGIAHLREFGFWLLNHAEFEGLPAGCTNRSCILLVLDPSAKAAAISFGYALDPYLDQDDTFDCLSRAHAWWLEGRHLEGVLRVISRMEELLHRRHRQAKRDPRKFASHIGHLAGREVTG